MPQRINKRLGTNAIVSTLLKNVSPNQTFKDQYPNDYRIRRDKFVVQSLRTRDNNKKIVVLKHQGHGDDLFKVLPGSCRLERPGPPNQYFSLQEQQQNGGVNNDNGQQEGNAEGNEEEGADVEPVEDGMENAPPPLPEHGWDWRPFRDVMEIDWRGAAQQTEPHMTIGGLNPKDMKPGQFFDAFFPWDYVRDVIVPATNNILVENKKRTTTVDELKVYISIYTIISINPGYQVRDFFVSDPQRIKNYLWNPPYLAGIMARNRWMIFTTAFE